MDDVEPKPLEDRRLGLEFMLMSWGVTDEIELGSDHFPAISK